MQTHLTPTPNTLGKIPNTSLVAAGGEGLKNENRDWVFNPTDKTLDELREIAPGWDRQYLVSTYIQYHKANKLPKPDHPQLAFKGWARKFVKGKAPS